MTNTNTTVKVTKKDYFAMVKAIVENTEVENKADIINFIDHEVELLNKKSAKASTSKKQTENLEIMDTIKAELAKMENPVTVSEFMNQSEEMSKYTNQKLSALLKKLVDANEVIKTIEKKKSYFSIA